MDLRIQLGPGSAELLCQGVSEGGLNQRYHVLSVSVLLARLPDSLVAFEVGTDHKTPSSQPEVVEINIIHSFQALKVNQVEDSLKIVSSLIWLLILE